MLKGVCCLQGGDLFHWHSDPLLGMVRSASAVGEDVVTLVLHHVMFLPAVETHPLQLLLPLDFLFAAFSHVSLLAQPQPIQIWRAKAFSLLLPSTAPPSVVSWLYPLHTGSQQTPGLRDSLRDPRRELRV